MSPKTWMTMVYFQRYLELEKLARLGVGYLSLFTFEKYTQNDQESSAECVYWVGPSLCAFLKSKQTTTLWYNDFSIVITNLIWHKCNFQILLINLETMAVFSSKTSIFHVDKFHVHFVIIQAHFELVDSLAILLKFKLQLNEYFLDHPFLNFYVWPPT